MTPQGRQHKDKESAGRHATPFRHSMIIIALRKSLVSRYKGNEAGKPIRPEPEDT